MLLPTKEIYIPLWSYSNKNSRPIKGGIFEFTFHYGPIQIDEYIESLNDTDIYIPLWSYSNQQLQYQNYI